MSANRPMSRPFAVCSWLAALWICYVFLGSLPYKFTRHPDTEHIFGTIGEWLGGLLGAPAGALFASLGPYAVGGAELLTSLVLLSPTVLALLRGRGRAVPSRALAHGVGGLMAATVMAGAVFFHLATPLGIDVLHEGKSDGGSLFRAAVSILVLGAVLGSANLVAARRERTGVTHRSDTLSSEPRRSVLPRHG